jgi:hypothetical protein
MALRAFVVGSTVALLGCASNGYFAKDRIHETLVKDFASTDLSCTTADVNLSHAQAEAFFKRSTLLDYKTMSDNYPIAPCYIEGTLKYKGQSCDWKTFAGHTGSITCKDQQTYFACDTCQDLFGQ